MTKKILTLLICLWTGAVLSIAFIAAPAAFQVLPDRALAGSVAAQMFKVEAYGSLCVAMLSWFALRPDVNMVNMNDAPRSATHAVTRAMTHTATMKVEWKLWLALLLILICTVLGYFALTPQLQTLKAAQGSASAAYQQLHGISMGLYALKCAAWLMMSWLMLRRLAR